MVILNKEDEYALKVISATTYNSEYALVPCCFTEMLKRLSDEKLIDIIEDCPPLDVKVIITKKGRSKLRELGITRKTKIIK